MEKKEIELPKIDIPGKPMLSVLPRGNKVNLLCNFFTVTLAGDSKIFLYDVKFLQDVPANNTPLRRTIIRGLRPELEKKFTNYIFTGTMIYTPTDLGIYPFICTYTNGPLKYEVEFSRVGDLSTKDLQSIEVSKSKTALTFLNIIVKCLLSSCNMFPIGRTGKYLIPNGAKKIEDYPIEVWPGYYTSVNLFEAGLLLEVDYATRILRQETVYDFIKSKTRIAGFNVNDQTKNIYFKQEQIYKNNLVRGRDNNHSTIKDKIL